MSDLDEKGLEAAMAAYDDNTDEHGDVSRRGLEAAIRAYEAHKETTFDPTAQLGGVIPPPSAVPEEVAEVVEWLRCHYEVGCDSGYLLKAADLLEGYARPPSSSKP